MREEIIAAIKKDPKSYGMFYINNFERIVEYSKSQGGLKTDIFLNDLDSELDKIRFSAVLSDLSNIYPLGLSPDGGQIVITEGKTITIDDEILKTVIIQDQQPIIHPAFLLRKEEENAKFIREIEPLIISNRVILHNSRALIGLTGDRISKESGKVWQVFDVDPNSQTGNWLSIYNSKLQDSVLINYSQDQLLPNNELFEITIPYIKNIPLSELSKILDDNQDLLSNFRVNLKNIVKQANKDGLNIEEMKNDLIRPEVDKISHKFNQIQNIHRLKVIGTVISSATLGLISVTTMGIGAIISGFLGSGGLGLLIKNEIDYQKEIAKLQEKPLYLMWAFKKEN